MISFATGSYRSKKWYYVYYIKHVTYVFCLNYTKIKVDSCDSLPLEKRLTFHHAKIHIKSVWNKDQNYYYYNIFLEKLSLLLQTVLINLKWFLN